MKVAYRLLSSAMHSAMSLNLQRVRLARPGGPTCLFRSHDTAVALPSLLNRTRCASIQQRNVFAYDLVPIAHRHCHCAALASNTEDTAAATAAAAATGEQSVEADVQQVDSGVQNDSVAAVDGADLHASTPGWPTFLQELWSRGYFEENSSGKDMHAAIDSRRNIKKALQQFGRSRPDIILQLPKELLADVASQQFSERMDRKAQVAMQRLKADTAQLQPSATSTTAHATGRASTQDILRVLWVLVDTVEAAATQAESAATPDSSTTSSSDAAAVLARCTQAILELEQQPPDAALMAAAEAAAATPNAADYQQHQAVRTEAASAAKERRIRGNTDTSSSTRQRGSRDDRQGSNRKEEKAAKFPTSDDPVVQHKLRLLRSAPYQEMRAGDWFCGQCGTHNYSFKQLCFRCEVPSNSLGVSKVTANDVRQLQQIGLGQPMVYEQRPPAAAFTLQIAQAVTADLSIPAAAKAAGLRKFVPVALPEQDQAAAEAPSTDRNRSSASSSRGTDRERDSSSRGRDRDTDRRGSSTFRDRDRDGDRDTRVSREADYSRRGSSEGGSRLEDRSTQGRSSRSPWETRQVAADRDAAEQMPPAVAARQLQEAAASDMRANARSSSDGGGAGGSSLADALKEAFAGLDIDLGTSTSTSSAMQPQEQDTSSLSSQQQQGGRAMEEDLSADVSSSRQGQVRRLRRQQPGLEPPVEPDSSSGWTSREDDGLVGRGRAAGRGSRDWNEPSDSSAFEDDLSAWADEYSSVVGDRGRTQRASIVRGGSRDSQERGRGGRGRGSNGDYRSNREEDGWGRPCGGGRGSRRGGGRGGRGGSSGGGGRRRDRDDGASSKPSWSSIFD